MHLKHRSFDEIEAYLENRQEAPAKIPDYTLIDALIGYQTGPWELAVNARNLTNKEYLSNCNDAECYYGETRSVIGTVNYRW